MATVKEVCWSSKYCKPFQTKLQIEVEKLKYAATSKVTVKTAKNIRAALKLRPKKLESGHNLAKKLVDSLQLLAKDTNKGPTSQVSLCLEAPLNSEDLSKVSMQCTGANEDANIDNIFCDRKPTLKVSCGCFEESPTPSLLKERSHCCANLKCCVPEKPPKCCAQPIKPSKCPPPEKPPDCPPPEKPPKCPPREKPPKCPPSEKPPKCCAPPEKDKKKGKCCILPTCDCCDEPRPKRKKVMGKRTKHNSSICIINESVKTNCCACCCLLAEYFQEILRLFAAKNDTRLSEIFCELCDVTGCLCNDCLNFLKKLINYICSITKCG